MNSYRRLWDTGFWAPVFADWGYQNRTCALRISAPGRFEYRSVDAAVNPYLMAGALLKAFDDGITNKIDPGEPEERNIYEAMEAGKKVKKLPMTPRRGARCIWRTTRSSSRRMPGEMHACLHALQARRDEKFMATVTNWDLEQYWDILPLTASHCLLQRIGKDTPCAELLD